MRFSSIALSILCALTVTSTVMAQEAPYPNKPVTMIVPFPPGGGTDTGARWIAQRLSERWGQSVVIDNKPGASGMIGAELVSRAKPDGYTLMTANSQTVAINPALQKKMPYNSETAFTPISMIAELPLVLIVNSSFNAKTAKELILQAKAKPGELTYGSAGNGSVQQLAATLFEIATDTKLMHVPYKGGGPMMQDVMAGHTNMTFPTILESASALKNGRVRAIAVTSSKRSPALPDVPTLSEAGLPGYLLSSWIGMLAPAGTPKAIVDKIAADVQEIIAAPEMQERLIGQGATPAIGSSPEQFKVLIDAETKRYKKLIVETGISLD